MIILKKPINFNWIIALCLAMVIHVAFLSLLHFIQPQKRVKNNFIELIVVKSKHHLMIKKIYKPQVKSKRRSEKTIKKYFPVNDSLGIKDSIKFLESDTNNILTGTDSFIIANPNITILKIAAKEKLKNYNLKMSKSGRTKKRIVKAMKDYYKSKYPTPPYKFGEIGTGNLINIPIDSLIKLFK